MELYKEWVREIGGAVIKVNPEMKPIFNSLSLKDKENHLKIGTFGNCWTTNSKRIEKRK
ncbi:hypothetical protein [Priestia endophytica]|uniref:hypothetical protein n=1 Tax=Priestia endophytica TaxID=135735 RepID=UPI00178C1B48|nr:hypothetical protein [Priestia endophytica]